MTPRLKRTLLYCLVAFSFLSTMYYVVYGLAGDKLAAEARLSTSLMYAGITTMFLGAIHYYVINKPGGNEGGDAGAE